MAIDRLELRVVALPLARPFAAAHGTVRTRRSLLVKVGDGHLAGWGECGAFDDPYYLPETIETARHIIERFIAPAILDEPLDQAMLSFGRIRGNRAAKSAMEQALVDLAARRSGYTLAEHLGGAIRPVAVGAVASIQELPFLEQEVAEYVEHGYQRIKLKIHPGHDIKAVQMVRGTWPQLSLAVDANGSYDQSTSEALVDLDQFDLQFIEQPFPADELAAHARLAKRLTTPLCLDESIVREADLEWAIRLHAAQIISIKPARVGGPAATRRLGELIQEHGLSAWVGGMLETGVGRAHSVALATLPWFDRPADLSASSRYFSTDLVDPPWELESGALVPRTGPGIGVEPVAARLEDATESLQVVTR